MQLAVVAPRFRADVKGKITPLVETSYGFEADKTSETQYRNMDRVRDLKKDTAFVYGEGSNGLPYHHPVIQQAINAIWFNEGRRSEGAMFANELYPLPYEAIALVLAAVRIFHALYPKQCLKPFSHKIECCLDEWSGGTWIETPFTYEYYKEAYVEHLAALKALTSQGLNTRHCDPLHRLRHDFYNEGRCVTLPCMSLRLTNFFLSQFREHAGIPPLVPSDGRHVWSQDRVNAACKGLQAPTSVT